jgi:hypothetical protein
VAAGAMSLVGVYHALRWIVDRKPLGAVAAGVAVGLAIATKFSNFFLIPSFAILALLEPLRAIRSHDIRWRDYPRHLPRIGQVVVVCLTMFITIWATYFFDVGTIADQTRFEETKPEWRAIPQWIKKATIPMPSAPLGFLWLVAHNKAGHIAYLNGVVGRQGWWYYFPEALLLKSPLALLIGCAAAMALAAFRPARRRGDMLVILIGVYFILAMTGRIDIGIRHLLPIIPLLYLAVTIQLTRPRVVPVLLGLIILCGIETATAHPDYMSFFNVLAGGTSRGERYLIDSNIDWGQDISRLAQWLHTDERARNRSYTVRLFMQPGIDLMRRFDLDPQSCVRAPAGLFAISKNVRYGVFDQYFGNAIESKNPDQYNWVNRYRRIATVGTSIDVYDLDQPIGVTASPVR